MGEDGKRRPRRYGTGSGGRAGRTWGGKLPEEFGTRELLLFAADNDLALYGRLTVDTLNAVREAGFRYEVGKLLVLEDLVKQGAGDKGDYPEVYRLSLGESVGRGETGRFWDSDSLNSSCRLSMDSAVFMNFKDGILSQGCLEHILEGYGHDRVEWVLANTIHQHRDDAKISMGNREWADGFHVPRNDPLGGSTWLSCVMNSPVEAVEQAACMVRGDRALQESGRAQCKPSIRKQLAENALLARNSNVAGMDNRVAEREAR